MIKDAHEHKFESNDEGHHSCNVVCSVLATPTDDHNSSLVTSVPMSPPSNKIKAEDASMRKHVKEISTSLAISGNERIGTHLQNQHNLRKNSRCDDLAEVDSVWMDLNLDSQQQISNTRNLDAAPALPIGNQSSSSDNPFKNNTDVVLNSYSNDESIATSDINSIDIGSLPVSPATSGTTFSPYSSPARSDRQRGRSRSVKWTFVHAAGYTSEIEQFDCDESDFKLEEVDASTAPGFRFNDCQNSLSLQTSPDYNRKSDLQTSSFQHSQPMSSLTEESQDRNVFIQPPNSDLKGNKRLGFTYHLIYSA